MANKCKYLRENNLCAARSFRIEGISPLAIKTISGGVTRTHKINPHFQCKGDLYFYVECHAPKTLDCPEYEPEKGGEASVNRYPAYEIPETPCQPLV